MAFKKPFRAVPIELGPLYQRKARRAKVVSLTKTVAMAVVAGVGLAVASVLWDSPASSTWNANTESRALGSVQNNTDYFARCSDARAAGVAPIHAGEPGYRPELDRDGDGIACEPYP